MSDPTKQSQGPSPHDEHDRQATLDVLLRQWHDVNADRAAAGRDRLLHQLRESRRAQRVAARSQPGAFALLGAYLRTIVMNRYAPALASLGFVVVVFTLLVPRPGGAAYADYVMVPEGGRLEALDDDGNLMGACPLAHTDVDVRVSGFMSRVTITQTYRNPYSKKIEALYTFPLSHRAAVDRLTITVGDRVVVGEVKRREHARQIYEAARAQGYVASLLEQQRPNIFTQSVANIAPGAEVVVQISYVELLVVSDGVYSFEFPMVVGPRYIPGSTVTSPSNVPAELTPREGVVLQGPAALTVGAAGDTSGGTLQGGTLHTLINAARPIRRPGDTWWGAGDVTGGAGGPDLWYRFEATYLDGSGEHGELYTDGTGRINRRWFYTDRASIAAAGTGFAADTNQVPDAGRISPAPVKPPTRAGHEVSISVTIDTGGPGVVEVSSELHQIIQRTVPASRDDGTPSTVTVTLAEKDTIPNRDFVLSWRQTADTIQEAIFVHTSNTLGDYSGGFFTLVLQPPDRIEAAQVPPRELVFVMDTSGSMRGFPIEKSKAVMHRAIDAMRPNDTFNVVTFAGNTSVMWDASRPATPSNRADATAFVDSHRGSGGTELMQAIEAALVQTAADGSAAIVPRQLVALPADDRAVEVAVPYADVHPTSEPGIFRIPIDKNLDVRLHLGRDLPTVFSPQGVIVGLDGRWRTVNGRRELAADRVWLDRQDDTVRPLRLALFLTDGYVGNDTAIIDAVARNAGTTRVFSFGIGNSVNRYLLAGMARAGRGEAEFVLLNSDADEAVERFTRRIETPVLTDISLTFSEGLEVLDMVPDAALIPDLFDVKPLVIHGRYTTPGRGTLTIRGRTGAGAYERVLELELPEIDGEHDDHDVIATLWARAKVDDVLAPHLQAVQTGTVPEPVKQNVVALGEQFSIMTPFTSFVAVEKSRMTIGGKPVLVAVPIELPDGVSWKGVFGNGFMDETDRLAAIAEYGMNYKFGLLQEPAVLTPGAPAQPNMNGPAKAREYGEFVTRMGSVSRKESGMSSRSSSLVSDKREAPGKGGSAGFGGGGSGGGGAGPDDARKAGRRVKQRTAAPIGGVFAETEEAPGVRPNVGAAIAKTTDNKNDDSTADALRRKRSLEKSTVAGTPKDALADADVATSRESSVTRGLESELRDMVQSRSDAHRKQAIVDTDQRRRAGRVLHPALAALAVEPDDELAAGIVMATTDPVLVTVLVDEVNDTTRRALEKAGLAIEASSKSLPIIVGYVAVRNLHALAMVPGVRLIEPTRMQPS